MVDRRLGRGLEFFLSGTRGSNKSETTPADTVIQLELGQLVPSPFQPRTEFDPVDLQNLAASLRASGILQPILVRPAGSQYQIIAGERRWRAAKLAELERIPALVKEISDEAAAVLRCEATVVEGYIHRHQLDAVQIGRERRIRGADLLEFIDTRPTTRRTNGRAK